MIGWRRATSACNQPLLRITIKLYYNDHSPPHFHAEYGEYEAQVGIESFALLNGELPGRALGLVVEWAERHQVELLANWRRARQGVAVEPIAPLE